MLWGICSVPTNNVRKIFFDKFALFNLHREISSTKSAVNKKGGEIGFRNLFSAIFCDNTHSVNLCDTFVANTRGVCRPICGDTRGVWRQGLSRVLEQKWVGCWGWGWCTRVWGANSLMTQRVAHGVNLWLFDLEMLAGSLGFFVGCVWLCQASRESKMDQHCCRIWMAVGNVLIQFRF